MTSCFLNEGVALTDLVAGTDGGGGAGLRIVRRWECWMSEAKAGGRTG